MKIVMTERCQSSGATSAPSRTHSQFFRRRAWRVRRGLCTTTATTTCFLLAGNKVFAGSYMRQEHLSSISADDELLHGNKGQQGSAPSEHKRVNATSSASSLIAEQAGTGEKKKKATWYVYADYETTYADSEAALDPDFGRNALLDPAFLATLQEELRKETGKTTITVPENQPGGVEPMTELKPPPTPQIKVFTAGFVLVCMFAGLQILQFVVLYHMYQERKLKEMEEADMLSDSDSDDDDDDDESD
ncbi:unnamed protein product [Amoebophrya sp. A120]|nr:unnamed protein product [Amoebophrya sp. A120]|eukprot:GSA120T00007464001.1